MQKIKLLMALSLCAGVGAVLCAIASGSHFHFSISNGSWNYDFRVGADSNLASGVLGFGAMVLFLAGLGLHLSQGGRGGQGDEASPFAWFSDFAGCLRRLRKSDQDSWIGGVCGGLGEHTPIPSWVWRLMSLVALFCYGTGVVAYVLLWICLPEPPEEPEELPSQAPPR